jgi:3-dehydroquinate synthase
MARIRIELGPSSYEIVVENGLLEHVGEQIEGVCRGRQAIVITEPRVADLYLSTVTQSLASAGLQVSSAEVPGGEACKTLDTAVRLYDRLLDARLDRTGIVIALGGGVVGDVAGFVAATYLRGVDFVQVPTTLLAQVDASIGGKVGVDLPRGKNLVGAFHQPKRVLTDPEVLASLPRREFVSGLAELVKHGIIADRKLFEFVRSHSAALLALDQEALEAAIARSCRIKAGVVSRDEKESGLRAILNFGHTVGHGVEAAAGFGSLAHGEAVSIGMVTAALISAEKGLADEGAAFEIAETLSSLGLPVAPDSGLDTEAVLAAMAHDKKIAFGRARFVLLRRIGDVEIVDDVAQDEVRSALDAQRRLFGEWAGCAPS